MRLVVAQAPLRSILRWTQCILFCGAASMLAYCGSILLDSWRFQKAESSQLEQLLANTQESSVGTIQTDSVAAGNSAQAAAGLIGRIEIPRLGLSAILMEGTTATTLGHAAGHITGTALPGQRGNVGISGHRDTFFRPLRNIRQNDMITLTTLLGSYRYRVVSTKVVSPHNVEVLDSDAGEILTLVTCYPFHFVGPAPKRFIVRAERFPEKVHSSLRKAI